MLNAVPSKLPAPAVPLLQIEKRVNSWIAKRISEEVQVSGATVPENSRCGKKVLSFCTPSDCRRISSGAD